MKTKSIVIMHTKTIKYLYGKYNITKLGTKAYSNIPAT
jgi:hypothetical protein